MSQVIVDIDGFQVKLTNLDKILWADDGYTKAEFIHYFIDIADYILPLIKGRPLTLIRYPDGLAGEKFYSKNAPDFIPDWLPVVQVDSVRYIYVEKKADLAYLANLASLEWHAMTLQATSLHHPDTMIFDLDPSDSIGFETIKNVALHLCYFLHEFGYNTFVKTSGSKGLHIYVPLQHSYSREEILNAAKDVGVKFTELHKNTTLKISKEKREGKILLDIYRNHQSQTCIAPLSTRARSGAPVSMPILFEDVMHLSSSGQFTIKNALDYLKENHPWQNYNLSGSILHTAAKSSTDVQSNKRNMESYIQKRNFEISPEPHPETPYSNNGNRFVVQLHDATNLHYDLRLEDGGVLISWAIPKHLPFIKKDKKLAIRTEDHPLPYLDFEGNIPKGQYGGGNMMIFDKGTYTILKKDDKSYHFILHGNWLKDEYNIFHTHDNQWLIENKSCTRTEDTLPQFGCMLAEQTSSIPPSDLYTFELKWDGIRVLCYKTAGNIIIRSRTGRDISEKFPEVIAQLAEINAEFAILDGELVSTDQNGSPVFANIISRMHSNNVKESKSKNNAVLYVFDLLYLDGIDIRNFALLRRRDILAAIVDHKTGIRLSASFDDGESLFDVVKNKQLEGIMAKKKSSLYLSDLRTKDWLKIKVRTILDVVIIGYTKGKGDRSHLFGALHVAKSENEALMYMGKVGTGWDQKLMQEIYALLQTVSIITKPIQDIVEEEYLTTWISPSLHCEVQYASLTPNGTLREPVFLKMKNMDE